MDRQTLSFLELLSQLETIFPNKQPEVPDGWLGVGNAQPGGDTAAVCRHDLHPLDAALGGAHHVVGADVRHDAGQGDEAEAEQTHHNTSVLGRHPQFKLLK